MSLLLKFDAPEIVTVSIFGALLIAFIVYLCCVPMKSWFTALFGGAYIPTFKLLSIKNRKLDVAEISNAYILSKKSGINLKLKEIESHVQAGGNIADVLKAMKTAKDAGEQLSFQIACAIDLANHNVVEAVEGSINSQVLTVEDIRGFTMDEREVIACAKVSVKLNLSRYMNGLGLEDLKYAVNAWILENIAHSDSYKTILLDPNKTLLKNLNLSVLGKKSMYNLLDISIASVEIGKDLNMEKQIQMAEKEKVYAQIEAEKLKHAEEIKELQMRTKTEAMKSQVLQAESEVPLALSQAIKEGRFSVMDYYKLMNLQADTALRKSIIDEKNNAPAFDDDDEGDLFE